MPFPATGILDNFNRANTGPPPSSNWSGPTNPSNDQLQVVSNQCVSVGSYADNWWNVSQFGDCECYFTIASYPDEDWRYCWLALRLQSPGTAGRDGYEVVVETQAGGNDNVYINRLDNAVNTQLGASLSVNLATGDSLGAEFIGSTLTVYHKTGGTWSNIGSRTDSTYGAGYIGIGTEPIIVLDDFGGGAIIAGPLLGGRLVKKGILQGRLVHA